MINLSRHRLSDRANFNAAGFAGGPPQNLRAESFPLPDFSFLATPLATWMSTKHIQKLKTNHKSQIGGRIALVLFVGVLACPDSLFALGTALPDQDTFATARGNAFVATADDPAAIFYNPAGISQLEGAHTSVGVYGIGYYSSYNGPSGSYNSKTQLGILPQVFSTWSLPKYNLTLGFGTYSPYGLRMEWPDNSPLSYAGQEGEIDYLTLNPVVAYQIIPTLSVAAGPTLSYSEADFKLTPPIFPGFINHFRGRDTDAGYNLGVLWHPLDQHSFGVTYRSASDMNYNGHATSLAGAGNIPAQANFHFPQSIAMGYSFRPTTNWNFEADATWSDWTELKTVNLNPQAAFGDTFNFDWHPSWMFNFGGTRYLGDGWRLSSGFMYSMNTVPDNTFNPLVPDSDRYIFSIGVGKKYNKFSWDVAYQFLWGPTRTVTGDNTFPVANGSYEFIGHALSINFGYRF
jgi:long-chain fatty acid transport protein